MVCQYMLQYHEGGEEEKLKKKSSSNSRREGLGGRGSGVIGRGVPGLAGRTGSGWGQEVGGHHEGSQGRQVRG